MPLRPGGILNPTATFPFCPDQTDFLCFRTPDGFGAVYLDLIEGFQSLDNGHSSIGLTNQVWYESTEPVPLLVARFAAVKRCRYSPERQETETQGQAQTTRPLPSTTIVTGADPASEQPKGAALPPRPGIWTSRS